MPRSAPGNRRGPLRLRLPSGLPSGLRTRLRHRRAGGFTLIELLVVVAIVALAAGLIVLALPDPAATRLEQEAARLSVLLEGARAESRSSGAVVRWVPAGADSAEDFRFVGLLPTTQLPTKWLDERVSVQVVGSNVVTLGPDAILAPQRIVLRLDDRRLELATDGLGPFVVASPADASAP
jgi:general secretion pathway protein H